MKRTLGGAVVVLAAMILLAGCTSNSGSSSPGNIAAPQQNGTAQDGVARGAEPGTGKSAASSAELLSSSSRDVVTTGTMSLTVADPIKASSSAERTVTAAGGRVDSSTEKPATDGEKAGATLVLRIPSEKLTPTLDALKKLGTLNSLSLKADDVTSQVKDVGARITALQTSVDRLLDLMSRASTTADLISIESTLSDRQAQLDSLKAQKSALDDQVELSTITLELHAAGTVATPAPATFFSGLGTGWDALVAAGSGLLVVLGVLLPWLAVAAVLAAAAWWIVRATRRRNATAATTQREG
jgi:hypothetical protein